MQNNNLFSYSEILFSSGAGGPAVDDQSAVGSAESYTQQPFPAYWFTFPLLLLGSQGA